ncbi:MAG: hypothetical protein AAF598_06345 [Bacteroidota bacterium]
MYFFYDMVTQDIASILFSHRFNAIFWLVVLILASYGASQLSKHLNHPNWMRHILIIILVLAFGVGLFPLMVWVDLLLVDIAESPGPGAVLYLIGLGASGLAAFWIQSVIKFKELPGYQSFTVFCLLVLSSSFSILLIEHWSWWATYVISPWHYLMAFLFLFLGFRLVFKGLGYLSKKSDLDL